MPENDETQNSGLLDSDTAEWDYADAEKDSNRYIRIVDLLEIAPDPVNGYEPLNDEQIRKAQRRRALKFAQDDERAQILLLQFEWASSPPKINREQVIDRLNHSGSERIYSLMRQLRNLDVRVAAEQDWWVRGVEHGRAGRLARKAEESRVGDEELQTVMDQKERGRALVDMIDKMLEREDELRQFKESIPYGIGWNNIERK